MGKKKRKHPDIEDVLARPWCYYCERDFDDLRILIQHQKAKHFKCEKCYRRLNTAGGMFLHSLDSLHIIANQLGLVVHMQQVHKEQLNYVENALPNRSSVDIEIFGIEGIPDDVMTSHKQRVIQQFYEAAENRRIATGNPPPGTVFGNAPKKSKTESHEDIKKRLAEHIKKRLTDKETSGGAAAHSGATTPNGGAAQPSGTAYVSSSCHHTCIQLLTPIKPPGGFSQPPASFPGQSGSPTQQFGQNFSQPPFQQGPYPQPGFSPPHQFPPFAAPGQQLPPRGGAPPFPGAPAPFPSQYPPASGGFSPPGGSSAAHGLPQRPSFNGPPGAAPPTNTANAVDELISSVKMEMDANRGRPEPEAETAAKTRPDDTAEAKPTSKSKTKGRPVKFVYMSEVSPEERMAGLPRYAFEG